MSYKFLHDLKCHTCSDTKFHTIFAVKESVILIKFGELSYFGNFFDFSNILENKVNKADCPNNYKQRS